MRICLLQPNKDAYSETFIANHIKHLKPEEVLYDGWYPTLKLKNNKSFLSFPFHIKLFRGAFRQTLPALYHKYYTNQLAKFLLSKKIELVLAEYGPMGVSVADACQKARVPLVVHFHGFDAHHYETLAQNKENYFSLFQKAKAIVVVSKDMQKSLLDLGGSPDKLWLNPYSIDTSKFKKTNPQLAENTFVFVGRFTAKKNPHLLIKSFQKVVDKIPDAKLLLAGEGQLLESTKKLTEELNLKGSVQFLGRLNPEEVAALLQKARTFVQHSLTAEDGDMEGTPNTILEASSSALPVISTFHAGIKEAVIHKKTGFLVHEGDWETMAKYMIQLAEDPALAQKMGEEGRNHILENYSLQRQMTTFDTIFNKAIQ